DLLEPLERAVRARLVRPLHALGDRPHGFVGVLTPDVVVVHPVHPVDDLTRQGHPPTSTALYAPSDRPEPRMYFRGRALRSAESLDGIRTTGPVSSPGASART